MIPNHSNHQLLQVLVLAVLAMGLVSCGASKTNVAGNSDWSSRLPTDTPSTPEGPIADCSGASNTSLGLTFEVSSYYMPTTQQPALDILRLHFSDYPDAITSTETTYIQMYRWSEDTPGQRITNPTPVQFYFQSKSSGHFVNQGEPADRISRAVIQNMIVKLGGSKSGITPTNFFDHHILILIGMDLQFDAMSVAVYDQAKGSSAIGWQDVLLPAFLANPNDYNASHSALSLQQLHPNYDYRNGGYSSDDYLAFTDRFCQEFM